MEDLNFHWTNGRNLSSITYTDDNNEVATLISFKYDDNGIRVSKTYGDVTTYYTNINGNVTSQYELDGNDNPINVIEFIYDTNDEIIGFTYQNDTYFYIKNIQGDITNIVDNTGNVLVNYYYDAWGVPYSEDLSNNNLAEINPMRYRGYYYDCEMGLYYLQSRYYIPTFCRFLNSDLPEYAKLQKDDYAGTNLFAYCCNEPINNVDANGFWKTNVHNGFNKGFFDSSNVKINGRLFFYGTYFWAKSKEVGFTKADAKVLAKYCDELDKVYPSKKYAMNLYSSKSGIYYEWQFYHFNSYNSLDDSRKKASDKWYKKAVDCWKKKKHNDSLKWLGYGLHCLQDIEAHGQIGAGLAIPQHIKSPINSNYNWEQADTPIGYYWTDSKKISLSYKKNSTKRLYNTEKITKKYLIKFINEVGYKR